MNINEKKNNIKFSILAIVLIIVFAFALSPRTLQNDTYYTIKIGELIVNNGIDMKDHFSWHQDLPYTYPHWAYDTGIYLIYNLGQNSGIPEGGMIFIYASTIILTSILGILIYLTASKVSKNRLLSFIVTLGTMYLIRNFIAARAQLVTFILFVLTILFIESFLESKKKRYLFGIVIISFLIANIHVAVWPFFFVLFMPYIAEYIIALLRDKHIICNLEIFTIKDGISKLKKKLEKDENNEKLKNQLSNLEKELKISEERLEKAKEKSKQREENPYKIKIQKNSQVKFLIIIMIICLFTGFLTPIHDTPYTYLLNTMKGNTTKSISEHLPLTLYNDTKTMVVLTMLFAILIFTTTKIKLRDLFMVGGLIFLSFMSRRQTSLLFLIGCFTFAKLVDYIFDKYDKDGFKDFQDLVITNTGKVVTIILVAIISLYMYAPKANDKFINESSYPVEASTWILENLNLEEVKLYNEYNYGSYLLYRGIPVFIDSRADLYAPEFNNGRDIFSDYINLSTIGTYYEDKFEEYGITHLIMGRKTKLNMFISRNDKYKELYKDDYFVIYERNK